MIFKNIRELFDKIVKNMVTQEGLINYIDIENMAATTCAKCLRRERIYHKVNCIFIARCSWCSTQHRLFKSQLGTSISLFDELRLVCYYILGIRPSTMCLMLDKGKETIKKHIKNLRCMITREYASRISKIRGQVVL
ncbi:hypothetical protein H311_02323 [Anncaliia algerae PRA109]|nr:hypothetical protein H311_02323 [Anncaliia algerae PRA109]